MEEQRQWQARPDREEPDRESPRESPRALSVEELSETANVPVRTVRYYIAEGLLPGPGSRGKLATYGEEHLARLRLIRRLVERRVPLAELRERVAPLTLDEVLLLLREEDQLAEEQQRAEHTASPKDYVSGLLKRARAARDLGGTSAGSVTPYAPPARLPRPSATGAAPSSEPRGIQRGSALGSHAEAAESWHRQELVPGVELHIRADAAERYRELIRRLLTETHAFENERREENTR